MDKGEEEVESLAHFPLALSLAYIMLSAWVFLVVVEGYAGSIVLVPLILGMLTFVAGNIMKHEGIAFLAWIGLGVGFTGAQFSLPNVTYLSAIASVMLMLVLIDLADFLRLMGGSASRSVARTGDLSVRSHLLIKKHFLFVMLVALLSSIVSLTVLVLSVPIKFTSNPVFALALLMSVALLVIAGALLRR